ncbi:MAG: AI-2E family transporter, partial [Firmicutes bacterium]|nr:AI-2E family transporter [Bacillota bacterium]
MKLPWDKRYLKISFHVVFTAAVIILLWLIMKDFSRTGRGIYLFFGSILRVMAPLIWGAFIAFILDPAVEFFQNLYDGGRKKYGGFRNRKAGTLITYGVLFSVLTFGIWMLVSKIGSLDMEAVSGRINESLEDLSDLLVLLQVRLAEIGVPGSMDIYYRQFLANITGNIENGIYTMFMSLGKAGSFFINLIVGFAAAFYFLSEKDRLFSKLQDSFRVFLPEKSYRRFSSFCSDLNEVFSGYIRGQIADALIMAVLFSTAFYFAGIKYAVLIGIISGILNIIPYAGAIAAFSLSVSVAFLSGEPVKALYAAIITIVLQQVDSIYISPRVMGKSVRLHPVA